MKSSKRFLILALAVGVAAGCSGKKSPDAKPAPPAKVANAVQESNLTTLTLSSEAIARLGIETVKAEVRAVPRILRLGGEIVARPGSEAVFAAPSAGVVLAPEGAPLPMAGVRVVRGQGILRLLPLPQDKDLIGARNDLDVKQAQYDAASAKARRAVELLKDKATSEKANEEARAELAVAEASLKAARARWQLLSSGPTDAAAADLSTLTLVAPFDGVIEEIEVASGQTVPTGAFLFKVVRLDPVWIRVPVYVGDLSAVDPKAPAVVETFGSVSGKPALTARPVQGPPLSDPGAASADLFFELANRGGELRLGQKVGVSLALRDTAEGLVVPWSAVLFDMQGGTWVYVRTAANVFTRVRVEIRHIVGEVAVLGRGPASGADVVSVGAAELFGTEFGAGK